MSISINANGPAEMERELLRLVHEKTRLEHRVEGLQRLNASLANDNKNLKDHLAALRLEGGRDYLQEIEDLQAMLEEKHPGARVTEQRKEISNLHRVIKLLKEQINAE